MSESCSSIAPQPGGDPRPRLGISACLLGAAVRYDGGHKYHPPLLAVVADRAHLLPFCPEVGCGLGVPRVPMRLEGDPSNPRLCVIPNAGQTERVDHTSALRRWCQQQIDHFAVTGLDGLLLKSRSPSCGLRVAVWSECAPEPFQEGVGLFPLLLRAVFPLLPMVEADLFQDDQAILSFLKDCRNH